MKSNIVKDSFFVLFTNGITYLTTILSTRLISGTYSLIDYGQRAQVLTISAVIVSVFSLGFSNCPSYFIPIYEGKHISEKIVRNLHTVTLAVCVLMMTCVVVLYSYIADYFNSDTLWNYEYIIIIMVIQQIYYSFYNGIQIANHRAIKATLTNLSRCLTTVILIFVLCSKEVSIFKLVLYTLLLDCVFCTYTVVESSRPLIKIKNWFDLLLIKEMAAYCIPLGISTITAGLCTHVDKLFVGHYFSAEDLAMYSNMCTELPLAAISGAFISVISPYIIKMVTAGKVNIAIDLWKNVIEMVAIMLFLIISIIVVFPDFFIRLLYTEKYLGGYQLFRIFIIVELARITYFGLLLRSYGRNKLILRCTVYALILNILLNSISYFLIGAGLLGFALSTMLSTFAIQLLQLYYSCKISNTKFANIFPWLELSKLLMLNICFGFIISNAFSIFRSTNNSDIYTIILIIIWLTCYIVFVKKRFIVLYNSMISIVKK